jgi:hypothetical protein
MLFLSCCCSVSTENLITGVKSTGKLTLVDLAGSERISKTEATGQRVESDPLTLPNNCFFLIRSI